MATADRVGLGVAIAAHLIIVLILSLSWAARPKPLMLPSTPIDVRIVDRVTLNDTSPVVTKDEPAPSVAPVVDTAPPEPEAPSMNTAPQSEKRTVEPAKNATTAPRAKLDAARPVPKAPLKGSRLGRDFLKGIVDHPSAGTAQAARAPLGPAVEASLAREVLRQLKPHWRAPTGADAENLRTELSIRLARDGSVVGVRVLGTTGVTDSNSAQVRVHQEAAMRAVRLASPFTLPAELYDAWKVLEPVGFDKRLGG